MITRIEYIGDLVSINQRSIRSKHGTIITSERYRLAKEYFRYQAKKQVKQKFENNVWVRLEIYQAREADIDSFLKFILDGMTGVAFDDDKQITGMIVYKFKSEKTIKVGRKKKTLPYVIATVGDYGNYRCDGKGNNSFVLQAKEIEDGR